MVTTLAKNLVTAVDWIQTAELETAPVRKLETDLGSSRCVVTTLAKNLVTAVDWIQTDATPLLLTTRARIVAK